MPLADVFRTGISVMNRITNSGSLQETVTHEAWSGKDGYGKPSYAAGVSRTAVVERISKRVQNDRGEYKNSVAHLMFMAPVAVDERDRFTLAGGTTGTIVKLGSMQDVPNGVPLYMEIWLGRGDTGGGRQ